MPARGGEAASRIAGAARAAARGECVWLFLFAWAALGCFVHTRDQVTWNVQHAWVESLAERGTLYVDGSATPRFALDRVGDTWAAPDGHFYPNSAPGTYLVGAAVYFVLHHAFGLSYRDDYDWSGTLVTFFTATLAAALLFVLLYRLGRHASGSRLGGLCVAVAFSFGTHAFPYSGVPYQHLCGALFVVAAFALAYRWRHCAPEPRLGPALEGLLLGLGITFSFAYVPMGAAIGVYCLFPLDRRRAALALAFGLVGLFPLLLINALHFGGPLTTVYSHSRDPNLTSYHFAWEAIAWRARFYLTEPATGVFFYSPVLLLAVPGVLSLPRALWRERLVIALGALAAFVHLLVVGGTGAAQFPPRLLIPILPFLALGFASIWSVARTGRGATAARAAFLLLLLPSIAFCMLGALGSTMFRDVARWNAWYVYLHNLFPPVPDGMPRYNLLHYVFPLRRVLAWVALVAAAAAAWRLRAGSGETQA